MEDTEIVWVVVRREPSVDPWDAPTRVTLLSAFRSKEDAVRLATTAQQQLDEAWAKFPQPPNPTEPVIEGRGLNAAGRAHNDLAVSAGQGREAIMTADPAGRPDSRWYVEMVDVAG